MVNEQKNKSLSLNSQSYESLQVFSFWSIYLFIYFHSFLFYFLSFDQFGDSLEGNWETYLNQSRQILLSPVIYLKSHTGLARLNLVSINIEPAETSFKPMNDDLELVCKIVVEKVLKLKLKMNL